VRVAEGPPGRRSRPTLRPTVLPASGSHSNEDVILGQRALNAPVVSSQGTTQWRLSEPDRRSRSRPPGTAYPNACTRAANFGFPGQSGVDRPTMCSPVYARRGKPRTRAPRGSKGTERLVRSTLHPTAQQLGAHKTSMTDAATDLPRATGSRTCEARTRSTRAEGDTLSRYGNQPMRRTFDEPRAPQRLTVEAAHPPQGGTTNCRTGAARDLAEVYAP